MPLRLVAGVRRAPLPLSSGRCFSQARITEAPAFTALKQKMPASRKQGGGARKGPIRNTSVNQVSPQHAIDGPIHSEKHILATYPVEVDRKLLQNGPKDVIARYSMKINGSKPTYATNPIRTSKDTYFRTTITTPSMSGTVTGVGDHRSARESERLAALSSVLQLEQLANLTHVLSPNFIPEPIKPILSDKTELSLDRAKVFMDYYCLKFGFESPTITSRDSKGRWEAVMSVGGSRIGIGTGINKKLATTNCYLDVVQYLDSSDPELWSTFVEETRGRGDAIGLAPPIWFNVNGRVADDIRDLGREIESSELHRNRPPTSDDSTTQVAEPPAPSVSAPVSSTFHEMKSTSLRENLESYSKDPNYKTMRDQRLSLPIHTRVNDLLELVNSQDVTIVMAATGSGKTTQIPQIILDNWIERGDGSKCNIICTQPRRIAAISVAERVAKERGQSAGSRSQVGYQVRFDAKLPAMHGSITFCTTGIFLKRMQTALGTDQSDHRSLDDATHIIIDEVHERDVDTDLTLAVLKRLLADRRARNKPLKIILMSATIDPTLFQTYFEDDDGQKAQLIDIPGRSFPVNKHYLEDVLHELSKENVANTSNWVLNERNVVEYLTKEVGVNAISQLRSPQMFGTVLQSQTNGGLGEDIDVPFGLVALTVAHVLRKSDSGHVLVFLPGWDEIQNVNRMFLDKQKFPLFGMDFNDKSKYSIHLLHSTIPVAEQQQVFEPAPEGVRRIILATNIAETSITIPDVVYVVDSGKVKEKRYDPERHMSSLVSAWVGTSNLNQRAGRAGRHRPGEYYSLVSTARANVLAPNQLVEMKRADLSNVVMHVKALDFPGMDIEEIFASLIEPPATARVHSALETLRMVGALTGQEELTPLGRLLLQVPIDAALGRMVLYGALFKCLDPALTLAAILSNREPFNNPPALKAEAGRAKNAWSPPDAPSDPIAALSAYNAWWELQSSGRYMEANDFCNRHFLNKPVFLLINKVKQSVLQALFQCGIVHAAAAGKGLQDSIAGARGAARKYEIPRELNENSNSNVVLGALIAVGSQPNFAVKVSERAFRTYQDKTTIIHPSSTSAAVGSRFSRDSSPRANWEKHMVAFVEKSRNVSAGANTTNAQTFLRNVTRLNNLQYLLFGAYKVKQTDEGIECDEWLPVTNGVGAPRDALANLANLKALFEGCMQRVFEGVHATNMARRTARMLRYAQQSAVPSVEDDRDADADANENEAESEDEDGNRDSVKRIATPLSQDELMELKFLTRDIVRVLEGFEADRLSFSRRRATGASFSAPGSLRGSPRSSPSGGSGTARLPPLEGSAFSRLRGVRQIGTASVGRSPLNSRPGTPEGLLFLAAPRY